MTRNLRSLFVAVVLGAVVGLSGCGGTTVDIASGTSELMQSTVVTAAGQAAEGDTAGALATLDALQQQLDKASAAGDVSDTRRSTIQESIDLVRADLGSAATPTPTEAPAPTVAPESPATIDVSGGGDEPANTGTSDNSGNDDKSDKSDKSDKPDKPDKPDKKK